MGTICILLGIITIILMTGGGVFAAVQILPAIDESLKGLLSMNFMGQSMGAFLGLGESAGINSTGLRIAVIAIPTAIGLFLGLNLIMNGLIYNKTCTLKRNLKALYRQAVGTDIK